MKDAIPFRFRGKVNFKLSTVNSNYLATYQSTQAWPK